MKTPRTDKMKEEWRNKLNYCTNPIPAEFAEILEKETIVLKQQVEDLYFVLKSAEYLLQEKLQ